MDTIYLAVNGDNVGEGIGNAIASDNHEELDNITQGLGAAHSAIQEWVESVGGKVVTSSGDEGIYAIPAETYDEDQVDRLRGAYADHSGTTVTVGVGSSMSEASKALIYGKLNDKDQVVEYDPHIDDYIADYDEDEEYEDPQADAEIPSDEELSDQAYDNSLDEQGEHDNTANNDMEAGGVQDTIEEDDESAIMGESSSEETEEVHDDEPQPEMNIGDENLDPDGDGDADMDADELVDEHEDLVDTLETGDQTELEDEAENQENELEDYEDLAEEGDETVAEEGEFGEEDENVKPEDQLKETLSEDGAETEGEEEFMPEGEETEEISVPEDQVDGDYGSEEMAEAQPEHEQVMGEEEEFVHDAEENRDDELDDDMIEADEEGEMLDEEQVGEGDQQGMISDMIHANMEGEDVEDVDPEELRQRIASALVTFKENKPMLEEAKTQNPKLYEATLTMIQSMIDMAKQLNMSPEQDASDQEAVAEIPEAEEEEEEEFDVEKAETVKLYKDLVEGLNLVKKAESRWDYWKRKEKQKAREKANRGKRINGKKPLDHALAEVERKMKDEAESKDKKGKK